MLFTTNSFPSPTLKLVTVNTTTVTPYPITSPALKLFKAKFLQTNKQTCCLHHY